MDIRRKTVLSKDGTVIYYETHGASQWPSIFLVHGIGGDIGAWEFIRRPLLAAGYQVTAMDLRGHGYSGHPQGENDYALGRMREDIDSVMRAEDLRQPILVGHSGGAVFALDYALAYQERLGGLVIISGSPNPPPSVRLKILNRLSNGLIGLVAKFDGPPRGGYHPPYPLGKHYKEIEWAGLLRTLYHNSLRCYALTLKSVVNIAFEHKLGGLRLPTLIIAGEADGIYPISVAKMMSRKISGARLVTIPGANHVVVLNNPLPVAQAIADFVPTL